MGPLESWEPGTRPRCRHRHGGRARGRCARLKCHGRPGAPGPWRRGTPSSAEVSASPLPGGEDSSLGPRVGAVRVRAPQSPALGTGGGDLERAFPTWPRGAEGPVYWPALGLQELGEPEEAEVRKLSCRLVSSRSRSGFAGIDFLLRRSGSRVSVSCPPSLLPSPLPEARPPAHADPGTHPIAATQTGRSSR